MAEFKWHELRVRAAEMIAACELSYVDIARILDISRDTLYGWRNEPDFVLRVKELREEYTKQVRRLGVANRVNRLKNINDRYARLNTIIREREADPEYQLGPGGSSGVMARKIRKVEIEIKDVNGIRKTSTKEIIELEVDDTLLKHLSRLEDQAAREVGEEGIITLPPENPEDMPDETLSDLKGS